MNVHGPIDRPTPDPQGAGADDERLLDWALGRLGDPQRQEVEGELAESPGQRRRVDAVRRTLRLLDCWQVEAAPSGLGGRIRDEVSAAGRGRRRIHRPSLFSLAEIGAIAAALLMMALIFVPPAYQARQSNQQSVCRDNLRSIGVAMERYANQNANILPFVQLPPGGNWLNRESGRSPSGTAPLFLLVRTQWIQPSELVCPACKDEPFEGDPRDLADFPAAHHCSYSFQNLFPVKGPDGRWIAPRPLMRNPARIVPILADRNPLFRNGVIFKDASATGNSFNHGQAGQNVLYNDGRVRWESNPEVGINHDNIWLAGSTRVYSGTETSADPDDSFMAP